VPEITHSLGVLDGLSAFSVLGDSLLLAALLLGFFRNSPSHTSLNLEVKRAHGNQFVQLATAMFAG